MQRRLAVILSALLLTGAQSAPAEPSQTSFHEEAYREAVRRAAIKTPELTKSVRLATIDDDLPAVTVIRLAKNDPVEECHGDPKKRSITGAASCQRGEPRTRPRSLCTGLKKTAR